MTQDVTTPVQIEAGRAERDGCGCPPQVVRCAHFDGLVVQLRETDDHRDPAHMAHSRWSPWRVYGPHEIVATRCFVCGRDWILPGVKAHKILETYDEAAALEAFHAAELRLLRGEPS